MKNLLVVLAVAIVFALGGYLYSQNQPLNLNLGASAGPDHYVQQSFYAGVLYGSSLATNTPTTATTLRAGDIVGVDTLVVSPTAGSLAYTFPASSTLRNLVPKVGQRAEWCVVNATTTASIDITFAGGTGVHLLKATSTSGGIGLPTIAPNDVGCFKFIRASSTSAAFDIYAAFVEYKDAD